MTIEFDWVSCRFYVNESADFNTLKELLGVTDGNLASHTKALEVENYIVIQKQFIGKKPNTSYFASKEGRKAFTWTMDVPQYISDFIHQGKIDGILSNYPSIVAYYTYVQ